MSNFVKITRMYQNEGSSEVLRQRFFIAPDSVESVRPASKPLQGQRSIVVTKSGQQLSVLETHEELLNLFGSGVASTPTPVVAEASQGSRTRSWFAE